MTILIAEGHITSPVKSSFSALLRVPSAITPEELNFVINVNHPDFANITLGDPRQFTLNDRVWKQISELRQKPTPKFVRICPEPICTAGRGGKMSTFQRCHARPTHGK